MTDKLLRSRWLGVVPFSEAYMLQKALHMFAKDDYLLLMHHPHVFTLGTRGVMEHILVDPSSLGAEVHKTDRGGEVTYHGPGQLVGYPIFWLPPSAGIGRKYVYQLEELIIRTLADLGIYNSGRLPEHPGVWIDPTGVLPRKICSIGVKIHRPRVGGSHMVKTMHGFALNVSTDLSWFKKIVPCGVKGLSVTSLLQEGIDVSSSDVVDILLKNAIAVWSYSAVERQDVAWGKKQHSVLNKKTSTKPLDIPSKVSVERKPPWLRSKVVIGEEYLSLKRSIKGLRLPTVCEEAGCPNIYECWAAGNATFMINGDRCSRNCKFCLVDTRHPLPLDAEEPSRVARAVEAMGVSWVVITAPARDDLEDGGGVGFVRTIEELRSYSSYKGINIGIEVLVPDFKGRLQTVKHICDASPDVFNHNVETCARLQKTVRSNSSYARSLCVLSYAKESGLLTKSGIMIGLGESEEEILATMSDIRGVGVDIITIGQYLRPSVRHLRVERWWRPEEFEYFRQVGKEMGFMYVHSGPLVRSSYHAGEIGNSISARSVGKSLPVRNLQTAH
ncbi:MAG: lipoyl synthase [Actinobacteria bacterium]|nr:lipoyl synthase [Actinomycetota bacterium]MCL6105253.1 lipoyl synthase [Actinomycetota bacterium]